MLLYVLTSYRLLPTAVSLLARLSNPLNVSLLASQLLSHPILYPQPVDLTYCRRVFSLFYTAALRFVESEEEEDLPFDRSDLSRSAWAKAVIQGADDRSPRWRHTLLLGGLLLGFNAKPERDLPHDLRKKLELALVTASNLSLAQPDEFDANSQLCTIWVLNVTFAHISDYHRSHVDYNLLLPQLIDATFFSREGLEHGYWLGVIDSDVQQTPGNKFNWSPKSPSGLKVQEIRSRNLITSLGPISRLIAHSVESVSNGRLILSALERLSEFSRNLALSWRQNKLSEVDVSEEQQYLDEATVEVMMPILLHVLRDTLFAIVISLRAVIGRVLTDAALSSNRRAPILATKCLHILRDTYFISHRFGQTSSSQFMFVYLTAIDILNQYPDEAQTFLTTIQPAEKGKIPQHPLERIYDLYFLNLAEHFTLAVSPRFCEDSILNSAMPYVTLEGDKRLVEMYEAAHSVLLATFTAPQNVDISMRYIPFYAETLLQSFPSVLSPRQFRLAIKSVVQLAAPPSPLSVLMPLMQPTILEMLHGQGVQASEALLPPADPALVSSPRVSEKAVLLLATMDCLPYLPVPILEDWLPITADFIHKLNEPAQKALCQEKFWDMLSNGEMDVERAATCVAWWSTRGGKELVLFGERPEEMFEMSGGIDEAKF